MPDPDDLTEEQVLAFRLRSYATDRRTVLATAGAPRAVVDTAFQPPRRWPDPALAGWRGQPWSVLLWGPVGTGKTMLASELLARLFAQPPARVRPDTWRRASALPELFFGEARGSVCWHQLVYAPAVLLDDLGRGHPGGGWEAAEELVATREAEQLPTLVTTNLPPAALERQSAALYDRLRTGIIAEMAGRSQRRRKR